VVGSGAVVRLDGKLPCVTKRDPLSTAVVDAARDLFAQWAPRGKEAGLVVVVNPMNKLFWRRWRIVEGLDLRVASRRNPPPEGLILGGHRSFRYPVRERRPFSSEWTPVEELTTVVTAINQQLTRWTSAA
jgi:hypothetical protein